MAKQKVKDVSIDAAIVIGGGEILQQYVVLKVSAVSSLLGNLPTVMGIDTGAIALGAASLYLVKTYIMK